MAVDPLPLDFGRDKAFCVYIYRDPRPRKGREPIYVGKGLTKTRPDMHWAKGNNYNRLFKAVLIKIRSAKSVPLIEYVGFFDDERGAFALEIALIKKFGRRDLGLGPLCNLTDGGEGGATSSREQRSAMAKKMWAKKTPEERSAIHAKREAARTPERRFSFKTAEERRENGRKGGTATRNALTPEQRNAMARNANAAAMAVLTTEQLSKNGRKGARARLAITTAEERSDILRQIWASRSPDMRSAIARKRKASMTPEQRSDAARKGHATKARKRRDSSK